MTVGYDEKAKKGVFAREFSLPDAPAFGTASGKGLVAAGEGDTIHSTKTVM